MQRALPFRTVSLPVQALLLLVALACGGGGRGPSPAPTPVTPPQTLAYATNPAAYTLGQVIPANMPSHGGGAVTGYTVAPALPAGLALDPASGILGGMPTVLAPSATYTVTASNAGGSTTAALVLTVKDAAPTNLVYGTPSASYTVGSAIPSNLATHGGGAVVTFGVAPALPAGLQFNTLSGAITGTPNLAAPTATYTVTATNSGGSTTASLALTVTDRPPTGLSYAFPTSTYTVGTAIAANTPSHGGGAVALYGVSPALPAGLVLDTGTGVLSGTPSSPAAAAVYTVTATNSGGSATCDLAITVNAVSAGRAWQAAVPVGPDGGGIYDTPVIGFDGQGNALAVWTQDTVGVPQRDLWANRYVTGTGWGTPQIIFTGVGTRVSRAQLGVDSTGKALVVWELMHDPYNPMPHIWSISYAPGTGWGTPAGIDSDTGNLFSGNTRLAVAANGTAQAVWTQGENNSFLNVCMLTGSTGAGWAAGPAVLATGPIAQAGAVAAPDVILNAQGAGFAFWQYFDGTSYQLKAAPITTGGAGSPQVIASAGTYLAPQAAVNAAGAAVVVWSQFTGSRLGIFASRFEPATGWGSPTQVNAPAWPVFTQTTAPQLLLDDSGLARALWVENNGVNALKVWSHQTAAGWASPELISPSLGTYWMTGNSAGQVLGLHFTGQTLFGSQGYLSATADWVPSQFLTTTGYIPVALAMGPNGAAGALWIQPVTGGYALWGSVYR